MGLGRLGRKPVANADTVEITWQFVPSADFHSVPKQGGPKRKSRRQNCMRILQPRNPCILEGVECIVSPATKLDLHIRVPSSTDVGNELLLASAPLQCVRLIVALEEQENEQPDFT